MRRTVAGSRAVDELLAAAPQSVTRLYFDRGSRGRLRPLLDRARAARVRLHEAKPGELDRLAGQRHQGVVAVVDEYPYWELADLLEKAQRVPLFIALDEITDPHNFGAIIRSAVAFEADGVITMKQRAAPVTASVARASAGATEHARICRVTNLGRALDTLNEAGIQTIGLAAEGSTVSIDSLPTAPAGRALVVGSEGKGLRKKIQDRCQLLASIPMAGPIASLNASVAAGIGLYASSPLRKSDAVGIPPHSP